MRSTEVLDMVSEVTVGLLECSVSVFCDSAENKENERLSSEAIIDADDLEFVAWLFF